MQMHKLKSYDSYVFLASAESVEKRYETGNSCILFGVKISHNSKTEEALPARIMLDKQQTTSIDAESDPHSDDTPSLSCEPEKSRLKYPQELQSRQVRSCTKVHREITILLSSRIS